MTTTEVRVGVGLPPVPERLGEWLGVASAFDAAGADSLWVELDPDSGLDPLAMVAALAIATSRARLVLSVDAAELVSGVRIVDTVRRLSHDRLTLLVSAERRDEVVAAVAEVPVLIRRGSIAGGPDGVESVVAEGRTDAGGTERWLSAAAPDDRESWSEICVRAAAREAVGVVVAPEDVLLAILRNPNPKGDRRDLNVASG